jgi:hypothetical protein
MSALATIHVGLKQLGIDTDDARDLYERQTGKRSLREMSPREQEAVIGELRRLGFERVRKGSSKRAQGPYRRKLQALWIACWNLGLARDRTDAALTAFVRRQTSIDHTRFLTHHDDASKVIEALKGWMERDGGVCWTRSRFQPHWTQDDRYRIASAQFARLRRAGAVGANGLDAWAQAAVDPAFTSWSADDVQWISVMNALGQLLRHLPQATA